jgi:hypothetical protein
MGRGTSPDGDRAAAADAVEPVPVSSIASIPSAFTTPDWRRHISFVQQGKEVMRITPDGELIIHDATAAAQVLHAEWLRLTGGPNGETPK